MAEVLKEENISLSAMRRSFFSARVYRVVLLSLIGFTLILAAAYLVHVLGLK
jgi:hypothetical protein